MTSISTDTTPQEPVFVLNEETFQTAWLKHKPVMDYDPEVFPKRFAYDMRMTHHLMKVEFSEKWQEWKKVVTKEGESPNE